MISQKEAARILLKSVREKRRSKWWLKDIYLKRHTREEIENAMNEVFDLFDDDWLVKVLNPENPAFHPIIQQMVPTGLHPFTILFELGRDLYTLRSLLRMDEIRKRLRSGSDFWAVVLEMEMAADCVRKGLEIILFPKIKNKRPDIGIKMDSETVYIEIMGMKPSERSQEFMEISHQIWMQISDVIPDKTDLILIPEENARFSKEQIPQIVDTVKQALREEKLPTIVFLDNSAIAIELTPSSQVKGFSFREPFEHYIRGLRRLKTRIFQKSEQIPWPYLGVIVIDVTSSLADAPKEHLIEIARDFFKEKAKSNIMAILIIRSFKFWKAKDEVLMVRNPRSQRIDILTKLELLQTFSRASPI